MKPNLSIASITYDCSDAEKLATFWSEALGYPVADGASSSYAALEASPAWTFIAVPEPKQAKNRVHLDLAVGDLEAQARRLEELGATRHGEFDEDGYHWITFTDPEGNEFDVLLAP
jgi:predicted enzyme related to lactoylglutathione lyase